MGWGGGGGLGGTTTATRPPLLTKAGAKEKLITDTEEKCTLRDETYECLWQDLFILYADFVTHIVQLKYR
jgi:hypothetical protein